MRRVASTTLHYLFALASESVSVLVVLRQPFALGCYCWLALQCQLLTSHEPHFFRLTQHYPVRLPADSSHDFPAEA